MLSVFPSFFDYSVVAVAVLRIITAVIFITEGYKRFPQKNRGTTFCKKFLPIIELLGGILLLVGFLTQIAVIILSAVSLKKGYFEYKKDSDEERNVPFYLLLSAVSLSFLFLGPGMWCIDYPL